MLSCKACTQEKRREWDMFTLFTNIKETHSKVLNQELGSTRHGDIDDS